MVKKPKKLAEITIEKKGKDTTAFESGVRVQFKAIGDSGTEIQGGYFTEEYLSQLRGKKGAKVWDEMRRSDAKISMLMNSIMNPIKGANWEIEAGEEPDAEKHKELIKTCLFEMIDFEAFKHEALTCVPFGFSLFEVVHSVVFNNPKLGTFNGLASLGFRSQKTIEAWKLEKKTGKLLGVEQFSPGDVGSDSVMPGEFLMPISLHKEGDNYEGIPALRSMYGAWFRKNQYLKISAIGVEKNAIGTPVGTVPKGKEKSEQFTEFKKVLGNFAAHESAYLLKPEGWEVEIVKGEFDADKVKELIQLENEELASAVVALFLTLGSGGNGGAYALGTDLSDFFLSGIQSIANLICGALNRMLIPNLIKLNYGEQQSYPKIKVTGINDKAGKEFAEILNQLVQSKSLKPDDKLEEFLRKQYKLPKSDALTARAVDVKGTVSVNPNLPESEAGQGVDVQKLSLNGAQVASLVSLVQRVAAGLLPRDSGVEAIVAAFNMSHEDAEKIMGSVGKGFSVTPEELQASGVTLSEPIKLDEKYRKQFNAKKEVLKDIMQNGMMDLLDGMKADIKKKWNASTPAKRPLIAAQIEVPGLNKYKADLKEQLAQIATQALSDARKQVPKAKDVKLTECLKLAAPRGGYFAALPSIIQNIVAAQANLLGDSQAADLNKIVSFQFNSSATTENLDTILNDINVAAAETIEGSTAKGMSVDAAAANAVAHVSNQASMTFFFDKEVLDQIESFTFTNEDPISDVCQELAGTTFAVGDPDLDQYQPPLHHNCKSRYVPNLKGDSDNPEIDRGGVSLTKAALSAITLKEFRKITK